MPHRLTPTATGGLRYEQDTPFECQQGGRITPLQLYFETYGKLNAARDNTILIHHGLSTGAHVGATETNPEPGWWQALIGPGRALDTERYFIICINMLGSCFGSSAPCNTATFPTITFTDMVKSQQLVLQALGIEHLFAIIGTSVGNMLSMQWLIESPTTVARALLISGACHRAWPYNIAVRHLQRGIMALDPAWPQAPQRGFELARQINLLLYRHGPELNQRFGAPGNGTLKAYLHHNAQKFAQIFDIRSYLALLNVLDAFDLSDDPSSFQSITSNVHIIGINSDSLYPIHQQEALYDLLHAAGVRTRYLVHPSPYGHDAFLIETSVFERHIRNFLSAC